MCCAITKRSSIKRFRNWQWSVLARMGLANRLAISAAGKRVVAAGRAGASEVIIRDWSVFGKGDSGGTLDWAGSRGEEKDDLKVSLSCRHAVPSCRAGRSRWRPSRLRRCPWLTDRILLRATCHHHPFDAGRRSWEARERASRKCAPMAREAACTPTEPPPSAPRLRTSSMYRTGLRCPLCILGTSTCRSCHV